MEPIEDNQIDLEKLLHSFEGAEIPIDMHAWFILAKEARDFQRDINRVESDIRDMQNTMKQLLLRKQQLVSIERHCLDSMNKVLPKGGEQVWENLA